MELKSGESTTRNRTSGTNGMACSFEEIHDVWYLGIIISSNVEERIKNKECIDKGCGEHINVD